MTQVQNPKRLVIDCGRSVFTIDCGRKHFILDNFDAKFRHMSKGQYVDDRIIDRFGTDPQVIIDAIVDYFNITDQYYIDRINDTIGRTLTLYGGIRKIPGYYSH